MLQNRSKVTVMHRTHMLFHWLFVIVLSLTESFLTVPQWWTDTVLVQPFRCSRYMLVFFKLPAWGLYFLWDFEAMQRQAHCCFVRLCHNVQLHQLGRSLRLWKSSSNEGWRLKKTIYTLCPKVCGQPPLHTHMWWLHMWFWHHID